MTRAFFVLAQGVDLMSGSGLSLNSVPVWAKANPSDGPRFGFGWLVNNRPRTTVLPTVDQHKLTLYRPGPVSDRDLDVVVLGATGVTGAASRPT